MRRERLYVTDEVDIALTYLRDIFLPVLPVLYARWERVLGRRPRSFLRPGLGSAGIGTEIRMSTRNPCGTH